MYAKVINPKTNGKKVYDNKGSSLRTANYLAKEAKDAGEVATFFGAPGSADKSLEEVVAMLDGNVKGLKKDDAKFYSLVLSPSQDELRQIGDNPKALEKYTQHVMDDYAKNFTLKNGRELGESNLVWAATIHDERKNRGTDEGKQGERKEGPQTHLHIIVSARDSEQKITLNPLSTPDRFNRVQFQAKAVAQLEIQFGRVTALDVTCPAPTRKQLIAEKAQEITTKAAANKREKKPLNEVQIAAKDARLDTQVARVNSKLDTSLQLDPERVKEAAKERNYDNVFYDRLGKIERNAEKGTYTYDPYPYLTTGRVSKAGELRMNDVGDFYSTPSAPKQEKQPEWAAGAMSSLEQAVNKMSRAMAVKSKTQGVRSEAEKEREHDLPRMAEWRVEMIPAATQRLAAYEAEAHSTPIGRELLVQQHKLRPGEAQNSEFRTLDEQLTVTVPILKQQWSLSSVLVAESTVSRLPVESLPKTSTVSASSAATSSTQQSATVPLVNEETLASKLSPESALLPAPRQVIATQEEENVLRPAVPEEVGQLSSISIRKRASVSNPIIGLTTSVPTQEPEVQSPVVKAVSQQPFVAAGPTEDSPSGELTQVSESVVSRSPLSPAVSGAVVPPVEPAAQPPQSPERTQKQLSLMSLAEKLISEVPDLPATALVIAPVVVTAPAVVTAPVVVIAPVVVTASVVAEVAEAVWQHGIIQMEANGKGTSEERLSTVRAALLAAGATVGEIVPPTVGRNEVPLLPYFFDPTTTSLGKVSQVLDDVQVAGKSKVQEQPYPWRQPASVPGADNMKWPDREGQFNQAHVLINDSAAGQARANAIAGDLRRAGARVSEVKRDAQGLLTMQVDYHTHTLGIDVLNGVLDSANNSIGIKVQESRQNRDARYTGAVQVAIQQQERSSAGMSYND